MMRILQVCNVGNICGGTAACAWSITHALADHEHVVVFLTPITAATKHAFEHCKILNRSQITKQLLSEIAADLIVLHNTPPSKIRGQECYPTIQYHHSVGERANAGRHVACSVWLHKQSPQSQQVLYQPIPVPKNTGQHSRDLSDEIIIGRICTPSTRKWPTELLPFYEQLADQYPDVTWEFVGVPENVKTPLANACRHRCLFLDAGFNARQHFWRWHAMLYHHPTLSESFGRTVAEAMRTGCVPIVDSRGGFCEQIENKKSGFLCSNFEDFASALQEIHDLNKRRIVAKQAIVAANERFSLETFYHQFRNLIMDDSTFPVQKRDDHLSSGIQTFR